MDLFSTTSGGLERIASLQFDSFSTDHYEAYLLLALTMVCAGVVQDWGSSGKFRTLTAFSKGESGVLRGRCMVGLVI